MTEGSVDPGTTYSPFQLNGLNDGTSTNLQVNYFSGANPNGPEYNVTKYGNGSLSDSFNTGAFTGASGNAFAKGSVTASDTLGALHGYTDAAVSYVSDLDGNNQAYSQSTAIVADTLTLSAPTTVTLSGTLEGYMYADNGAAEATMTLLFLNPSLDEDGQAAADGGCTLDELLA